MITLNIKDKTIMNNTEMFELQRAKIIKRKIIYFCG